MRTPLLLLLFTLAMTVMAVWYGIASSEHLVDDPDAAEQGE